jgi:Tfp pilus assembly protein PilO
MLRFFDRLNLTPAERRLVMIIFAVVFVVVNYWVVWPRFGDFAALSEEIESTRRKRDIYQREVDRLPTYTALLRKLQAAGSVLPPGEEKIQFRSDMERMAREAGLTVPRWGEVLPERGSGTVTNAFFESIGISLNQVAGTEAQFVDFLYRVGGSNSTIRVKDLTLQPGAFDARAQGKTNLNGTVRLVASVQRAQAKAVATNVAVAPVSAAGRTNAPAVVPPAARGGSRTNATAVPPPRT